MGADVSHDDDLAAALVGHSILVVDARFEDVRGAANWLRLKSWVPRIGVEPLEGAIYHTLNIRW